MIRRWIRERLPKPSHFDRYVFTRPFKKYLSHPSIWALNRRSVAGAVAAGLFCGLIPGPLQLLGALLWVVVAKVNLPIAFLVTVYTNPLTIVPLYFFVFAYGQLLLGGAGRSSHLLQAFPQWEWGNNWGSIQAFWDWGLSLGPALAVGLPATMLTFAVVGYLTVRLVWNLGVRLAVVRRRKKRLAQTLNKQ